ncbi:hypothetical protein B296_00029528 [Ensete ventricosum]|uniref:Uncharacterized protein n=1 Tax=Ensete ventricosum TaxID=4639 RepID=A0A426X272_ENSVE|nr:hypothetical protein B296_00029528 [Ensete ventricosum]
MTTAGVLAEECATRNDDDNWGGEVRKKQGRKKEAAAIFEERSLSKEKYALLVEVRLEGHDWAYPYS